jgi:hypothetical protein
MSDGLIASWDWRWPTATEVLWGVGLFVLTAGLSLAVTAWIFINLPANYFVGPQSPAFWSDRHPFLRWFGRPGKNIVGGFLVILGIILALPGVPGQGILTILIGLMFLDIPGKRRMEQRLVALPRVSDAINRLRRRFGRAELEVDPKPDNETPRIR